MKQTKIFKKYKLELTEVARHQIKPRSGGSLEFSHPFSITNNIKNRHFWNKILAQISLFFFILRLSIVFALSSESDIKNLLIYTTAHYRV